MISDLVTLILGLQRYTFNDKLKILFEIFLVRKSEKPGRPKEAAIMAKKTDRFFPTSGPLTSFFRLSDFADFRTFPT